jgi:hypothetical protein
MHHTAPFISFRFFSLLETYFLSTQRAKKPGVEERENANFTDGR